MSAGPILMLDRDGVIILDHGYVGRQEDVEMVTDVAPAISRVNAAGIPVVIVTNQSGIARGHYGWDGFVAVQDAIDRQLKRDGAHVDAVLACGYHESRAWRVFNRRSPVAETAWWDA